MDHRKSKSIPENIYLCFIDYSKAFDCVDHNKLWKILKDMGIPDYLTCLLRNLYADQETTVRTRYGKNGLVQNWERSTPRLFIVILLFKLPCRVHHGKCWAEMNHKLESRQLAEILINLRYADDTTLMAESKEELKSLLMEVKEKSGKVGLKLKFRKLRSWHLDLSLHGK